MYAILSIAFLSAIFAAIYGWVVNIATVFSGFDIMAGGEASDLAEAETLLSAMGRATHVGVHGAGQVGDPAGQ